MMICAHFMLSLSRAANSNITAVPLLSILSFRLLLCHTHPGSNALPEMKPAPLRYKHRPDGLNRSCSAVAGKLGSLGRMRKGCATDGSRVFYIRICILPPGSCGVTGFPLLRGKLRTNLLPCFGRRTMVMTATPLLLRRVHGYATSRYKRCAW